jgi:hypothetical protein
MKSSNHGKMTRKSESDGQKKSDSRAKPQKTG